MIILIDHTNSGCTAIHIPQWLVMNRFNAWMLALFARWKGKVPLHTKGIYKIFQILRQYQREHPDLRIVEISRRDGEHVSIWI